MIKEFGFQIIFGTDMKEDDCIEILDKALSEMSNRSQLDFLMQMSPKEIAASKKQVMEEQ